MITFDKCQILYETGTSRYGNDGIYLTREIPLSNKLFEESPTNPITLHLFRYNEDIEDYECLISIDYVHALTFNTYEEMYHILVNKYTKNRLKID